MPDLRLEGFLLTYLCFLFYLCVWTAIVVNGCFYMYEKGYVTGLKRTVVYQQWKQDIGR